MLYYLLLPPISTLFPYTTLFRSGFCLLILRYIRPHLVFDDKLMKTAFWWLNGGLALMLFTSLLPIGIIQFVASASEGLWYARSESFMQTDLLVNLRWIRTFGDVVFIVGALAVAWQVVKGLYFPSEPTRDSILTGSSGSGQLGEKIAPAYAESDSAMALAHQGEPGAMGTRGTSGADRH